MNNFRQDIIYTLIGKGQLTAFEIARENNYDVDDVIAALDEMKAEGLARPTYWGCECESGEEPCDGCTAWEYAGGPVSKALAEGQEL